MTLYPLTSAMVPAKGVDDPVGVVVSSGGTVGDTVGLGDAVGEAEGDAVDVGDGVTRGVGSGDAVPDGELPALGGIPVPDGPSVRAVEELANMSALVDAESTSGTRAGAGRIPTGGATSLGDPELASRASRCTGKGCRALAGGSMVVQAVVAACSGTLSFDGMPMIATIATTAKEPATTAISLASSLSRPISPRCLSVCEDRQFWTVTRSVTISAIPFRWSDRRIRDWRLHAPNQGTSASSPLGAAQDLGSEFGASSSGTATYPARIADSYGKITIGLHHVLKTRPTAPRPFPVPGRPRDGAAPARPRR
jgi:hypothetical protein